MTRFQTNIELADAASTRFEKQQVWVDTDALYSQFSSALLTPLGYESEAIQIVEMPDGRHAQMEVGDVQLRINGDVRTVTCLFDSKRGVAVLGRSALEEFGLTVDEDAKALVAE